MNANVLLAITAAAATNLIADVEDTIRTIHMDLEAHCYAGQEDILCERLEDLEAYREELADFLSDAV